MFKESLKNSARSILVLRSRVMDPRPSLAAVLAADRQNKEAREPSRFWKEFWAFYEEFRDESDRAAVVLGAARLDIGLRHLLDAFLLPDPSPKEDPLLDGDSPLSTFSARITASHRLGLVDADTARALHLVRKIRNAFAHDLHGCKLDSGSQGNRVRELCEPFHKWRGFKIHLEIPGGKHTGAALYFRATVAFLVLRIDQMAGDVSRVTATGWPMLPDLGPDMSDADPPSFSDERER